MFAQRTEWKAVLFRAPECAEVYGAKQLEIINPSLSLGFTEHDAENRQVGMLVKS